MSNEFIMRIPSQYNRLVDINILNIKYFDVWFHYS